MAFSDAEKVTRAYAVMFSSPAGEVVLADLKKSLDRQTYTRGDTHQTAFMEGRRSVLLDMLALIEHGNQLASGSRPTSYTENPNA